MRLYGSLAEMGLFVHSWYLLMLSKMSASIPSHYKYWQSFPNTSEADWCLLCKYPTCTYWSVSRYGIMILGPFRSKPSSVINFSLKSHYFLWSEVHVFLNVICYWIVCCRMFELLYLWNGNLWYSLIYWVLLDGHWLGYQQAALLLLVCDEWSCCISELDVSFSVTLREYMLSPSDVSFLVSYGHFSMINVLLSM